MLILFYLFCSGKTEDNLAHIFNLFDQDGNKVSIINNWLIHIYHTALIWINYIFHSFVTTFIKYVTS